MSAYGEDATRSADESAVDVVICAARPDGAVVPVGSDIVVFLTEPGQPDQDTLTALRGAEVELVSSEDVPSALITDILKLPTPARFADSPWLHDRKALVFTDGRCAVGSRVLRYDEDTGLGIEAPKDPDPGRTRMAAVTLWSRSLPPADPDRVTFDLIVEPWIPVVALDGSARLVGLADLVLRAHEFHRIAAEAPTMTAALHRLVIALLHRVYGPPTEKEWAALWQRRRFPEPPLRQYLSSFGDRFDLFHPEHPFMQCPALANHAPASAGKLVPYRSVGNNVTLFDHTTARDTILLTPAEAARWLVTAQSFDTGGMKTPYEKDKSSERAHCNSFGVVLVEGDTLLETLLLNTLVYAPEQQKPLATTADDHPIWEAAEPPSPQPDKRVPRGWTDLLTWPSRRVLLSRGMSDGQIVIDGVVLTPGTRPNVYSPDEEAMAAFRRSRDAKDQPQLDKPLFGVRLEPLRGIWRHSVELLTADLWEEGRSRQRPRVVDHVADLGAAGVIEPDKAYSLRVMGQKLDSKASVVEAWLEEEMPAPLALLRPRGEDQRISGLLGAAVTLADKAGSALRAMQREYLRDMRANPRQGIDRAFWPRLDRPFHRYLNDLAAHLDGDQPEAPAIIQWKDSVDAIAKDVAAHWGKGAADGGRAVKVLGLHLGWFHTRLAMARRAYLASANAYANGGVADE